MACAGKTDPDLKGLCFNTSSKCDSSVYFYESEGCVLYPFNICWYPLHQHNSHCRSSTEPLCPDGLACCTGKIIGIDPIQTDRLGSNEKFAENVLDDGSVAWGEGQSTDSTMAPSSDYDLLENGLLPWDTALSDTPGKTLFASGPSASSSPLQETDYAAFLGPIEPGDFVLPSAGDGTASLFGPLGDSNGVDGNLWTEGVFGK
jgi:hypothetical protein